MKRKTNKLSYEYLYNNYIIKNKTMKEIADENGVNIKTVSKKLKNNNLTKSSMDIYKSQKNSLSNPIIRAKAEYNKKRKREENANVNLNFIEDSDCMDRLNELKKIFRGMNLDKDEKTLYNNKLKIKAVPISYYSEITSNINNTETFLYFTDYELNNIRTFNKIRANITNKLNLNIFRISAKKCVVRELTVEEKNLFLDLYDFNGPDKSNVKLGLFYYDELVAVMTFSTFVKKYNWKLNRFCVKEDYSVYGGASKLFNYFKANYLKKDETVVAYSDKRKFDGKIFDVLGFKRLTDNTYTTSWYKDNVLLPDNRSLYKYSEMHNKKFLKVYNYPIETYLFTKKE